MSHLQHILLWSEAAGTLNSRAAACQHEDRHAAGSRRTAAGSTLANKQTSGMHCSFSWLHPSFSSMLASGLLPQWSDNQRKEAVPCHNTEAGVADAQQSAAQCSALQLKMHVACKAACHHIQAICMQQHYRHPCCLLWGTSPRQQQPLPINLVMNLHLSFTLRAAGMPLPARR